MAKQKDSYASYLFHEGTNYQAHKMFSPAPSAEDGVDGWDFAVWAPSASSVSVVGDFNDWDVNANRMQRQDDGVWTTFIAGATQFQAYKYAITFESGETVFKCDPYGLHFETAPANASKLYDISGYRWKDKKWMRERENFNPYGSPINIYEIHFGSWKKYADGNYINYSAMADELIPYVKRWDTRTSRLCRSPNILSTEAGVIRPRVCLLRLLATARPKTLWSLSTVATERA